jgi:hypothetical protein
MDGSSALTEARDTAIAPLKGLEELSEILLCRMPIPVHYENEFVIDALSHQLAEGATPRA